MSDKASESYLLKIVAIAVSEQKRAGFLYLNVFKAVRVKDLSCDLYTGQANAVFATVILIIFYDEPCADYSRHESGDK
jgi:hypothetical protein